MAHTLRNKLRGLAAAFVAVMTALAIVPGAAFAADWTGQPSQTGTITITGDRENQIDTTGVHVYQVGTITYTASNNTTDLQPVGSISKDLLTTWATTPSTDYANAIANYVNANGYQEMTGLSITPNDSMGVDITDVPMGIYYIKIDTNSTTAQVYQNIVVGLSPVSDDTHTGFQTGTATVEVKSADAELDKTIVSVDGIKGTGAGDDGVYKVGDAVSYDVNFTVGASMTEFHLDDIMGTGLDYHGDLKVYAKAGTDSPLVYGDDYTVDTNVEGVTFRVTFTTSGIQKCAAGAPHMTYTAKINGSAVDASGASQATNEVTSSLDQGGDTANLAFAGIKVFKYEGGKKSNGLEGAVFGLYDSEGTEITTGKTDGDGNLTFNALLDPTQTYTVKEISAPSGYQSIDTVFTFIPDGQTPEQGQNQTALVTNGYAKIDVANTPSGFPGGIGLPTTGGTGTVLFTAVGVVIIAGAAAFIARSRKQQND